MARKRDENRIPPHLDHLEQVFQSLPDWTTVKKRRDDEKKRHPDAKEENR
ncbi:hypothetical protein [Paludifilum halophilum]|nr:hypothetical protein [Paludifilum halophilum]